MEDASDAGNNFVEASSYHGQNVQLLSEGKELDVDFVCLVASHHCAHAFRNYVMCELRTPQSGSGCLGFHEKRLRQVEAARHDYAHIRVSASQRYLPVHFFTRLLS